MLFIESMARQKTSIGLRPETKELVRSQKRGGETYDELLRKMAYQYDPDAVLEEVEP